MKIQYNIVIEELMTIESIDALIKQMCWKKLNWNTKGKNYAGICSKIYVEYTERSYLNLTPLS